MKQRVPRAREPSPGTRNSAQTLCPIRHMYDQPGMCEPVKCPPGTFVSCAGKKSCDPCPKGRYCSTATSLVVCPGVSSARRGRLRRIRARPVPGARRCPSGSQHPAIPAVSPGTWRRGQAIEKPAPTLSV